MNEREQKLLQLKKRLLANKNSAVLTELQELNKSFSELKEVFSSSKDISEVKNNLEIIDRFDSISKEIKETNQRIKELTERKLPTPNVIMPGNFRIDNFPKKTEIDWENFPKQEKAIVNIDNPIKTLYKSIEGLLGAFFGKVSIFMSKVTEYITDPDKVIVTRFSITEVYRDKKVIYKIKDDGNSREITRET